MGTSIKKIGGVFLVACILLIVSTVKIFAQDTKSSPSQSTNISVNKTYQGSTNSSNNDSYYKFTTSSDGQIDIKLNENQDYKYRVELFDSKLKSHGVWYTDTGSKKMNVRMGLAKGTYYISIRKDGHYDANTKYTFCVNSTSSNYWEKEFNNDSTTANSIKLGSNYYGMTDKGYGSDYYKFTVSRNGYIDVKVNRNQNYKFKFELLNSKRESYGTWVTNMGSGSDSTRIGLAKGTYYINISNDDYYSPNTQYSFSVKATSNGYWEQEFNNTSVDANAVSFGYRYYGITDSGNRDDYYKFTVSESGEMDIKFNRNQDYQFNIELYNSNRESKGKWSTNRGSGTDVIKVNLSKGTYYLKVN
ncbi:MAG: hypothetical protein ACRCXA_03445, partial [Peptostreptococcaceae bacterium]